MRFCWGFCGNRVFDDGFWMVYLWWFEAFSWWFAGMFLGLKNFLIFEIYFGVSCGKGRAANPFWEWRTESIVGCRFFPVRSAFVADKVDDV
jgi:hypothetical protein